jgi:hypothetical protein
VKAIREDLARALEERLLDALSHVGFAIQRPKSDGEGQPDFILQGHDGTVFVGVLKVAKEPRSVVLEGHLASALLTSRRFAALYGGRPLAIVAAPALSERLTDQLRAFADRFGERQPFGLYDGRGKVELHGPGLPKILTPAPLPEAARNESFEQSRQAKDLFSDLNQCLLKVMLAQLLPETLIHAKRDEIRGPTDLARLASASPATAHRFLERLEADGFLAGRGRSIALQRVDVLLERWSGAMTLRPQRAWRARFLLPTRDPEARLDEALRKDRMGSPGFRACRALFGACKQLGFGHASESLQHLYLATDLDGWPSAFDDLGLRPASEGETADVALCEARWPRSVFRSAVVKDGIAVTDIVQCWLDTVDHPARGTEQANLIWDRAFVPFLGIEGRAG